VLAAELLKKAEELLDQNVHPTVIARGYRAARQQAARILAEMGEAVSPDDALLLAQIAMTAMTGKSAEAARASLAGLVLEAVRRVTRGEAGAARSDVDSIKVDRRVGPSSEESELIEGVAIDRGRAHPLMPEAVKDARIALLDCPIDVPELETDAQIQITDPAGLTAFLHQEETVLAEMARAIVDQGATAVFCQRGIHDMAGYQLARAGVLAVARVPKSDLEKLARATGARIVSSPRTLGAEDLGQAGLVRESRSGDVEMVVVEGCERARAVTLFACGGTAQAAEEVRRVLDDAIRDVASVLRLGRAVGGAGAVEVELGRRLHRVAGTLEGKERLAVQAFARALDVVPRTLAENAGLDPIDVMSELELAHERGRRWAGIDVNTGQVLDTWTEGIVEPLEIKTQALGSATEVAVMILRIDDVIVGEQIPREAPGRGGAPARPDAPA
jgi:chaperonin GroEL (HSP60 family)